MKIGKFILIILLLVSCDNDDETPIISDRGYIKADLSGKINLKYESNQVQATFISKPELRNFYMSSQLELEDTTFTLAISINKDTTLIGDFVSRVRNGFGFGYSPRNYGIDEDEIFVTDSSIYGTFSFTALRQYEEDLIIFYDTVYVENGEFEYKFR